MTIFLLLNSFCCAFFVCLRARTHSDSLQNFKCYSICCFQVCFFLSTFQKRPSSFIPFHIGCSLKYKSNWKTVKSFLECLWINGYFFFQRKKGISIPKIVQVVCIGTKQSIHKDNIFFFNLFHLIFFFFLSAL